MLIPICPRLYHIQKPFRIAGIAASSRMTVVQLSSGKLWLHSPVRLDDALKNDLNKLGEVEFVVAPNLGHHLFIGDYVTAFPKARFFRPQGLEQKRPDLAAFEVLSSTMPLEWQADFEQKKLDGIPKVNEWVWLHRPSKTLILTDCVQWHQGTFLSSVLFAQLMGVRKAPAVSRLFASFIKHKSAFAKSCKTMLEWDFDRVVLGHDALITQNARSSVVEALKDYL